MIDILGIGNAIVDVVARADDAFLSKHDMHKGGMMLIDAAQASALYDAMPPGIESSGGSAGTLGPGPCFRQFRCNTTSRNRRIASVSSSAR